MQIWHAHDDKPTKGMFQASLGGDVINLMIRVCAISELSDIDELVPGMRFTHLGKTIFTPPSYGSPGNVKIPISTRGRTLESAVRVDCMLTQTARVNMSGEQDGELIVGVYKGGNQFELIACGYLDILAEMAGGEAVFMCEIVERWGKEWSAHPYIDLADLVKVSFGEMGESLTFRKGARLVNVIGKGRESSLQDLYYIVAPFVFAPAGVKLQREVGTGLGIVDFQVTRGDETHLIEFKQWKIGADASKLLHGLRVQLPSYIEDSRALRGWLAVFVVGDTEDVQPIYEIHETLSRDTGDGFINVIVMDARYQHPASKRSHPPRRLDRPFIVRDDPFAT